MKGKRCRRCKKWFRSEERGFICPTCKALPLGRIDDKNSVVEKPKKKWVVDKKQCKTCKYQAEGITKRNGILCAYQDITGKSKIVVFPDCKAPPNCPAYQKGRRLKSRVRCTV